MPDEYQDPSSNTQAFRAFAQGSESAEPAKSNRVLFISIAAAALLAVVVAVVLLVM
jgi:hypothetical protein